MILVLLAAVVGLAGGNFLLAHAAVSALVALAAACAVAAALALAAAPRLRRRWAIAALPAALLVGAARGAATVPGPGGLEASLGYRVTLVGEVARASGGPAAQSFWLSHNRLGGAPVDGMVQVSARSPVVVVPGSVLRVTGTLERLPGRAPDGSTGFDDRMERLGVLASMPGATFSLVTPPGAGSLTAMAWRARDTLALRVRAAVPEPEATILLGELVGIRSRLPPAVESQLVSSGLVHVLAVSGLKVALVAGLATTLLRRAGRRAALLAVVAVFAYVAVGGASAAAVRSAVMGSLGLVAQVLRRDPDPPRSLLLAAAGMLGLNPALAGDLSFQYSFLGVAGIHLLEPRISARLAVVPPFLREGLAVTIAAQVATLPLTAAYFHVVPLLAPLSNSVVIPTLGPGMAVTAWLGAGLPDPFGVAALLASGSARLLLGVAALTSGAGTTLAVPWFGLPHALAYLAAVAPALCLPRAGLPRRAGPRLVAGALATPAGAAVLGCGLLLALSRPDGHLHLRLLDTPGGGALVTAPDGARLLVDTGTKPAALTGAMDAALAPPNRGLDAVLLTSSAPAAAGGVEGLGSRRPSLVMIPSDSPGDVPQRLAATLGARGAQVRVITAGDRLQWHGLELVVDGCGDGLAVTVRLENAAAWLCSSGTAADPGRLPPVPLALVDLGPGLATPGGDVGAAAWVVAHGTRAPPAPASAAALGPRLWRPSRDGPLDLVCDPGGCRRG